MRRHGQQTYPHECCGVLVGAADGDRRTVHRAVACGNAEAAADWYAIDPREILRIEREARAAGHDVVGFYHSHPDSPARWSASDLAEAHWLGCSYCITRVDQSQAADTNSFALLGSGEDDKHFDDEPVVVED